MNGRDRRRLGPDEPRCVGAGERRHVVDDARDALDLDAQVRLVAGRVDLALQRRHRLAELLGGVAHEVPLAQQRALQPLQHAVQRHRQSGQARRGVAHRQTRAEVAVARDLVGGVRDVLHQLVLDGLGEPAAVREVEQAERDGDERQAPRARVPRDGGEQADGDVAGPRQRVHAPRPEQDVEEPLALHQRDHERHRPGVDERADGQRQRRHQPPGRIGRVGRVRPGRRPAPRSASRSRPGRR